MHIMQRDGLGLASMKQQQELGLLSKLRPHDQLEEQIPRTTLSIGSLDRGSVDSCGSSFKNPWYVPSCPMDIAGPKRKRAIRDLSPSSASLDESEIVLALGSSPSSCGVPPSTALGLGHADSLENNSGCSSFDFERNGGRFSAARNFGGLRLGLSTTSSSEDASVSLEHSQSGGNDLLLGLGQQEETLHKQVAIDEGSSSARWMKSGGVMLALLHQKQQQQQQQQEHEISDSEENFLSEDDVPTKAASVLKMCKFEGGCGKGARGASGLCIAHGGGRRCQREGCNKGAEGRTVYCKAHGGGRRCNHLGCTKSAEGKTDHCISHGGGRRCSHENCGKAARGRSGLCIRHGGGKRCQREGCTKSAEGFSGLCISHGGGRRCQAPECTKGAQGSTLFCKAHGGGKRCMMEGCGKGAEGSTPLCKAHGGGKRCMYNNGGVCSKSVHGGTLFCVAHGGGKRCGVQGCSKSARGRTAFCVKHGGGKRCQVDSCGKSAQGSTDFCKAHGGGKRCIWGQQGSPYYYDSNSRASCDRFARGKLGLCAAHTSQVIHDDNKARSFSPATTSSLLTSQQPASSTSIVEQQFKFWTGMEQQQQQQQQQHANLYFTPGFNLIPPRLQHDKTVEPVHQVSEPEGRVHGGCLLALLSQAKQCQ